MATKTDSGVAPWREAASSWFYFVMRETDASIKKVLKRNTYIVNTPIGFLTDGMCACANRYEELCPEGSDGTRDEFILRNTSNIAYGHCDHVLQTDRSDLDFSTNLKHKSKDEQDNLLLAFFSGNTFCQHSSQNLTWVYPIHILIARGFEKSLIYSFEHMVVHDSSVLFTHRGKLFVLYIAVLHRRYNMMKLLRSVNVVDRICKYSDVYKHISIENSALMLAIKQDDVKALMIFQKDYFGSGTALSDDMLFEAFKSNSTEVLKYIFRNKTKEEYSGLTENILQYIMVKNLKNLIGLVLRYQKSYIDILLQAAVDYDSVEATKMILEIGTKKRETFYPDYLRAVLNRSTEMLNVLVKSPIVTPGTITDYYEIFNLSRAKRWSKMLQFDECTSILETTPQFLHVDIDDSSDTDQHPLIEVFDVENIKSQNFTRTQLVERLIFVGWSVNSVDQYNNTPLLRAVKVADYTSSRKLLFAGADPTVIKDITTKTFIKELLFVNVDIYNTTYLQCLANFNIVGCKSMSEAATVSILAIGLLHTVKPELRDKLSKMLTLQHNLTMEQANTLHNILNEPRPLYIICRNKLRQHFGVAIHSFVNLVPIPPKIQDILLLNDCLKNC